jgi:NAD(P)H-dependent FMN reductase
MVRRDLIAFDNDERTGLLRLSGPLPAVTAKIVALSGSLRAASINMALLQEISKYAPHGITFEIASLGVLPLFNPDLEIELPDVVASFRAQVMAADAAVIASPEYAHGISGVLKNALDWLVGDTALFNKPVLVLNAAPRAHHANDALREILATMSARVENDVPPVAASVARFLPTLVRSELPSFSREIELSGP